MSFIQLGGEHYNELCVGKLYTKVMVDPTTQEETTKYYAELLGGQNIELTQEEYNELIGNEQ